MNFKRITIFLAAGVVALAILAFLEVRMTNNLLEIGQEQQGIIQQQQLAIDDLLGILKSHGIEIHQLPIY